MIVPAFEGGTTDVGLHVAPATVATSPEHAPSPVHAPSPEHAATTAALRLPCGHAFHAACAVQALLRRPCCPKCLASTAPATAPAPPQAWDAAGSWSDDGDSDVSVLVRRARDRVRQLNVVRSSDDRVKHARALAHATRTEYNALRERLRRARRQCVATALKTFRKSEQAHWREAHRLMHRALRKQHAVEQAALRRHFGEEAASLPADSYLPDSLYARMHGSLEPTARSFWVG